MPNEKTSLPYRVDVFCSGGWQHRASFAGATDAYEYGERCSTSGARVWDGEECVGVTYGPRSWRGPRHNRNCDGKPCECGAVPPIGSMELTKLALGAKMIRDANDAPGFEPEDQDH